MGRKVNPIGIRLSLNKDWGSHWYADKTKYPEQLKEDILIRKLISQRFHKVGVVRTIIEKFSDKILLKMHCIKPGVVIGQKGKKVEAFKQEIVQILSTKKRIDVKIIEVAKPDRSAQALAENVALQLQSRVPFRRAMKHVLRSSIHSGVKGVKVKVAGRLNGADMARSEYYIEGRLPLQTFRANIDVGFSEADTTFGKIGVRVWLYLDDSLGFSTSQLRDEKYTLKRREK